MTSANNPKMEKIKQIMVLIFILFGGVCEKRCKVTEKLRDLYLSVVFASENSGGVSGMVRKIAVILEFKYTECLQSYLLFIALYLLLGTEC